MLWFEDIEIGPCRTTGEYLITESEIIEFARKWDPQPFHTDPQVAAGSEFGRVIASSAHVFCILGRLFSQLESLATICGLENGFVMTSPVYPNDLLKLSIWCESKRLSTSNPERGIVTFQYHLLNHHQDIVFDGKFVLLVKRQPPA